MEVYVSIGVRVFATVIAHKMTKQCVYRPAFCALDLTYTQDAMLLSCPLIFLREALVK